jgi:hypothetical protein
VKTYAVTLTFTEPLLGSQPQKDVASDYIHKVALDKGIITAEQSEEELETLPDLLEKGSTVFHRMEDDRPCIWDYQVKGLLKEWGRVLNGAEEAGKVLNLKNKIGNLVFVTPRIIPIEGITELDWFERPLRAETAKGPRIALARSERINAGATVSFKIHIVLDKDIKEKAIRAILDMGQWQGLGQFRSGSYGRFAYTLTEVS